MKRKRTSENKGASTVKHPKKVRHLTKISDISVEEFNYLVELAIQIKENPLEYTEALKHKTLLMLFEKPSLRTHISFETGMHELGGHAIYYSTSTSPLGKKETYSDTGKVLSRYVHVIMARVKSRTQIHALADNSTVPVINALDDFGHPCQILADFMTIYEKKGRYKGLKMTYLGDTQNNVTYDLMRAAAIFGMTFYVCGPDAENFKIEEEVIEECKELCKASNGKIIVTHDPKEAVAGADVIYTDSWMSYTIPESQMAERKRVLMPYQVNEKLVKGAKKDFIFMNCLPALRGMEQTEGVIDGMNSVVFDEAENRQHAQKALLIWLAGNIPL